METPDEKSIHDIIPISCLVTRFTLSSIMRDHYDIVKYIVGSVGYTPGELCSSRQKYIASCIFGSLEMGLSYSENDLTSCLCDNNQNNTASIKDTTDLMMKMLVLAIKHSENLDDLEILTYNVIIIFVSAYEKGKKINMFKLGKLIGNHIMYFKILWNLVSHSFKSASMKKLRDEIFSYVLKNEPSKKWLQHIDIPNLSNMLKKSGDKFIRKHISLINQFPHQLYHSFLKKSRNIEPFIVNNRLPGLNHDMVITRNIPIDINDDLNVIAEISGAKYINDDMTVSYKENFLKNSFDFLNCSSEQENNFTKHMYFYCQYVHHLDNNEFMSLLDKEFRYLNLKPKIKQELWDLYLVSQDVVDGKQDIYKFLSSCKNT